MTIRPAISRITINLGDRSYDILIGNGLLAEALPYGGLPPAAHAMLVTNEVVAPLYAAAVASRLAERYRTVDRVVLPDGEQHKDWTALNCIFDALLNAGCDRRTVIFALGGGVVGDVAGFAAACYMRGVPFVQIPTTLLAQVDSSVGGKTAINHPLGKNMIGAFHQPVRVISDLDTLSTLSDRELIAGLAEVIKYGFIADIMFLGWLESHVDALLARDQNALIYAIRRSCEIKGEIVGADEREAGRREILNFGHTFGHAIEAGLGYGEWLHGEAVGCGMVMGAELSKRMGLIDEAALKRVRALVARVGLPTRAPKLEAGRYMQLMRLDKKSLGGEIRFVLLDMLGSASTRLAGEDLVEDVLTVCAV